MSAMETERQTLPGLTTKALGRRLLFLHEVDSTNRYLKERATALPHGTACCTLCQTAGRGRLGRDWASPRGEALALSVIFRQRGPVRQLPLLCGLAVAQALEALVGDAFQIKWPNDIVCRGRKVCGILCESRADGVGGLAVVAGIGVNLLQPDTWFAAAGLEYGGSVAMLTGRKLDPQIVAAEILNRLEPLWEQCCVEGFHSLAQTYAQHCVNVGRRVRTLSPEGEIQLEGMACGIATDGSLLVDDGEKVHAVAAGEASVRGFDGYV